MIEGAAPILRYNLFEKNELMQKRRPRTWQILPNKLHPSRAF